MKNANGLVRIKVTPNGVIAEKPTTPDTHEDPLGFLLSDRELPSSTLFRAADQNPLLKQLRQGKKLTNREMLIVASIVIGSLDLEVLRLRRFEKGALNTIKDAINGPIFGCRRGGSDGGSGFPSTGESESPSGDEAHWFLKYVSLRNILAVVVVIISLSTAFFSFLNRDYRSLLKLKDGMVAAVQEEKQGLEKEKSELSRQLTARDKALKDRDSEMAGIRGDYIKIDTLNGSLKKQLEEANASRLAAGGSETQQIVAKDKQIETLNVEKADLTGKLKAAETQAASLRETNRGLEKANQEKVAALEEEQTKLSEARVQLNNAVDCWNEIMAYLYEKDSQGWLNLETKWLKQKLKNLEERTGSVPAMKSTLQ